MYRSPIQATRFPIRDITVRAPGKSCTCVGVNGAGKSTMIKVLTGELEPQLALYGNIPIVKLVISHSTPPSHRKTFEQNTKRVYQMAL